eukprot:17165-Heterococcus_DN1.PRE.1
MHACGMLLLSRLSPAHAYCNANMISSCACNQYTGQRHQRPHACDDISDCSNRAQQYQGAALPACKCRTWHLNAHSYTATPALLAGIVSTA